LNHVDGSLNVGASETAVHNGTYVAGVKRQQLHRNVIDAAAAAAAGE